MPMTRMRSLGYEQLLAAGDRTARYSRIGKMRRYRRRNLIHALRPHDGDFDRLIFYQVCLAFDVLPEELGLTRETGV